MREQSIGGANWFKAGDGTDRSFVTNISNGELGDIVFMGESRPMEGHAVLLNGMPVMGTMEGADGNTIQTMTLNVLSTSSDSDYNSFGERSMLFQKVGDDWIYDYGPSEDGHVNYKFRGYGQLNADYFQDTETETGGN